MDIVMLLEIAASVLSRDVQFPKWLKELNLFTVVLIIQSYFPFLILARHSTFLKVAQSFKGIKPIHAGPFKW